MLRNGFNSRVFRGTDVPTLETDAMRNRETDMLNEAVRLRTRLEGLNRTHRAIAPFS